MRFVSLFAGIGGFDLGLERAGMQCVGQVEIDPFCQAVLAHHWPHVRRVDDIRKVTGDEFGTVDLVCGGFPCQPHSTAGKRLRTRDDRFLWPEMLRVVSAIQPVWVLGENVSALDDATEMVLDRVCADLEAIGYEVGPPLEIPACAVDAPHERKRVFILAHSERMRRREPAGYFGPAQGSFHSTEREEGAPGPQSSSDNEYMADCQSEQFDGGGEAWRRRSGLANGCDLGDSASGGRREAKQDDGYGEVLDSYWSSYDWHECGDGKTRRIPAAQSGICPVAHGIPGRVAQLRGYGNAVVPQVVEEIGRAIMNTERTLRASCPPLPKSHRRTLWKQARTSANSGSKK